MKQFLLSLLGLLLAQIQGFCTDISVSGDANPCPGTTSIYGFHEQDANGYNIQLNADAGTIVEWSDGSGAAAIHKNVSVQEVAMTGYPNYNYVPYVKIRWNNVRGVVGHLHITTSEDSYPFTDFHDETTYNIAVGSPDITGTINIQASCDQPDQSIAIPSVIGATSYTWQNNLGWTLRYSYVLGGYAVGVFSANTANATGQVTVTANNPGCPATSSTKTFIVTRSTPNAFINGPDNLAGGRYDNYNAPSGGTNYTWSVPTGWSIYSGQYTATINAQAPNYDSIGTLYVSFTNLCGQSETGTKRITSTTSQPGPSGPATQDATAGGTTKDDGTTKMAAVSKQTDELTFYPNPVADEVHVNFSGSGKAVIYDARGGAVRSIEFAPQSIANNINTMSLPDGVYHLCLFQENKKVMDKQFVIKH